MLGDTAHPDTGKGMQKNLINMKKSFAHIAHVCDLPFSPKELTTTDKNLTRKHIINLFRKKSVDPDDIIILYYSGHGCREEENPTFLPSGGFKNGKRWDQQNIVDFSDITKHLLSKNASFYLIIMDCCNVLMPKDIQTNDNKYIPTFEIEKYVNQTNIDAISKLFLKKHGFIVVSATSPTEFGWSFSPKNGEDVNTTPWAGSVFTKTFLNKFLFELQTSNPT